MSYSQSQFRQSSVRSRSQGNPVGSPLSGLKLRLLIVAAIVVFSLFSYLGTSQRNPITGESERVAMTIDDEIVLGQQNADQMGRPSRDLQAQSLINSIGARLVQGLEEKWLNGKKSPFQFEFTLLSDPNTINAFALPGGQVFMTEGLFRQLSDESQVAGVLAHEMGHVIERHTSKQMAKSGLIAGVTGAAGVLGGNVDSSRAAAQLGNLMTLRYSRKAEFEADAWAVKLAVQAGFDPNQMIRVLEILKQRGGKSPPEFLSTHPSSDSRITAIRQEISRHPVSETEGNTGQLRVRQQFE